MISTSSSVNASKATSRGKSARSCCESCHQRKVRCDADFSGCPCTNCRLDERSCKIRPQLKRGRKRTERDTNQQAPTPGLERPDRPLRQIQSEEQESDHSWDASSIQVVTHALAGLDDDTARPTIPDCNSHPNAHSNNSLIGNQPVTNAHVPFYYHSYLKVADMSHLSPGQVRSVELEGCFQVPSGSVLDEFIRQYFLHVHTCLPILNECLFWDIYYSRTHDDRSKTYGFSLALFQAMLFAASRFVRIDAINACGFKDLKSARNTFHHRAESLLAHNLESDHLLISQTCLLLSLHNTLRDQSLNSMWLSKAISHAEHAGANRYFSNPHTDCQEMLQAKRLWWCCILRDRMIAIGVRRSIQISSEKFDFENDGLQESDLAEEVNRSEVYSPEMKRLLVRIIVAQCALAAAVTATMVVVYPTGNSSSPQTSGTISQLVTSMAQIERGITELMIWARRFKTDLTDCIRSGSGQQRAPDPSVVVFADMILIHYYSTQIALYNHLALVLQKHQTQLEDYTFRFMNLKKDLLLAITNVTERFKGLSEQGLAHRLPISAPSCSALPFILETLDLKLSSLAQKATHHRQLTCYNEIITLLDDQHEHTECVTSAINSLLPVADAEIKQLFASWNGGISGNEPGNAISLWLPSSWSDLLTKSPMTYLRLTMSLDLVLSEGKAPHVPDLPDWTRNVQFRSPSVPRLVLVDDEHNEAIGVEEDVTEALGQSITRTEQVGDFDIFWTWSSTDGLCSPSENLPSLDSLDTWLS